MSLPRFSTWKFAPEVPVPTGFLETAGGNSLAARVLARRGFTSWSQAEAFIDSRKYSPAPPTDLPGMENLVGRLAEAIRRQELICVWGDFDVDGQTSTTILLDTIRRLGGQARWHIPVRALESHGIKPAFLQKEIEAGVQVILTCDTGISAHEAAEQARRCGVDLLISDHHDLPPVLPQAAAIVNPHLLPEGHPLGNLPGAGVAYQVARALVDEFDRLEIAANQQDLAALGIVADVAEQTGDTRWLLQVGLQALREGRRPGLRALCRNASVDFSQINEESIGFMLAPRLNAIGRLGDANPMVEFFTTSDETRAEVMASELESLNARRRTLVEQIYQAAIGQVEKDPSLAEGQAVVLTHAAWEGGVVGIVASRLVEKFGKPAILLCTPPGEDGRGSARSVEGVNIFHALTACRELLAGFGGHAMAAGLSLPVEKIPAFRRALDKTILDQTGGALPPSELLLETDLPLEQADLPMAESLDCLAPFGRGNPALVFAARGVTIESTAAFGKTRDHLRLNLEDKNGQAHEAIWWQGAEMADSLPDGRYDIAYHLTSRTFQGRKEAQLEWVDARPLARETVTIESRPRLEILDWRLSEHPRQDLVQLAASQPALVVWREGVSEPVGVDRRGLTPGHTLVIWSAPPGPDELDAAMSVVTPKKVILVGVGTAAEKPHEFLEYILSLIKYRLNRQEYHFRLEELSAASGQRGSTVELALGYLHAAGIIILKEEGTGEVQIYAGGSKGEKETLGRRLSAALEETAAYRKLFRILPAESLVSPPPVPVKGRRARPIQAN